MTRHIRTWAWKPDLDVRKQLNRGERKCKPKGKEVPATATIRTSPTEASS